MFNGHGNTVNKKGTGDFKANNEIIELQYYNILQRQIMKVAI